MRRIMLILGSAAAILLQSCVVSRTTSVSQTTVSGTWPGTWPPPSSVNCPRSNAVPFSGPGGAGFGGDIIGPELTKLHGSPACVPQPTCIGWQAQETKQLSGPVSGQFWMGPSTHIFTVADQDTIISSARNVAIAQSPAGKRFYRLTFEGTIIVGGGVSTGVVQARAHYGQCISDISAPHNPRQER